MLRINIVHLEQLATGALAELLAESESSGFRFVRRLIEDWENHCNRFDRAGEALFAAEAQDRVVGLCGLNIDPYLTDPMDGRIRHLYVLAHVRGRGVGRLLVQAVVAAARGHFRILRLRTQDEGAARFYEALGFQACGDEPNSTHALNLSEYLGIEQ